MKIKPLYLLFTILLFNSLYDKINAQKPQNNEYLNDTIREDHNVPKLNIFIESALKNSPILKASDAQIEQLFEKIKKEKKSWADYLFIDANARYGLFNQLSISQATTSSTVDLGVKSAKEQFNYFAGLTFRIPISSFISKKNDIKILNQDLEQGKFKREQLKQEVTLLVIDEYYKLINLNQSLQLNQNIVQSAKLILIKSQKDIASGQISLTEYNAALTSKEKAEESLSKVENEYFAQYFKIQILTGLNLSAKK